MSATSLPSPIAQASPIAEPDNRRVLFVLGLLTPLGVFTTITIGDVPISIMWLAALLATWAGSLRLRGAHMLYLVLSAVLLVKFLLGGGAGTAAKFSIGVLFLLSLSPVRYQDGLAFFRGLNWMIPISLLYAAYQWAILLIVKDASAFGATLPIELWNTKGWHALLPDPFNLPRAPAFMFEPAYFAMILDVALVGELLYRRARARPLLVAQIVVGLLLANSRVGLVATLVVVATAWLARREWRGTLKWIAVLAAVGPLLPVFFISDELIDFSNNRDVIDISVFARYISFVAFLQQPPSSILLGVLNYHDTFVNSPLLSTFSDLLEVQGNDLDPKSFLASNLFQFGVLGSILFYGCQIVIVRKSARALGMLASINLIFFNVYAYSWPLYWIMISLTIVVWKLDMDTLRHAAAIRGHTR